jgi:hypothetical protein
MTIFPCTVIPKPPFEQVPFKVNESRSRRSGWLQNIPEKDKRLLLLLVAFQNATHGSVWVLEIPREAEWFVVG